MTSPEPSTLSTPTSQRGIYCLANDEALEWFQAFVRSLRKHDPNLPLTVIPYNTSMTRLKKLQAQFNFTVMAELTAARFDAIAHRVAGQRIAGGTFRKLCCFFGEYDTFLFLDSDIVVTRSLEPFLKAFDPSAGDFVYFDTDMTMVYKPEFARQMVAEYHSVGFNSGAFVAGRGSITETEILAAVDSGEKIREQFSIWGEQPFLNYLFDVTRRRKLPASALVAGTADKPWARIKFRHDVGLDQYLDEAGNLMPFIHWPGCEYPTMARPEVFLRHRTLGMTRAEQTSYQRNFYYRRLRSKFKETLLKIPLLARLLVWRDERIRKKRAQAAAVSKSFAP